MELLSVRGIDVVFGQFRALEVVDATFLRGEIHAVLGGNGAGKSTLMNVLGGFLSPAGGSVSFDGRDITQIGASERRRRGIQMVHQHFMLVPEFTVAENLALAQLDNLNGPLPEAEFLDRAKAVAENVGWDIPWSARTDDLPVGVQQRIEILKALSTKAEVLILDEPTAVLSPDEVQDLFRVLRRLRDSGVCIILIAHKLSEIMQIADGVTVLRLGKVAGQSALSQTTQEQIQEWMIGEATINSSESRHEAQGEIGLKVVNLWVRGDQGADAIQGLSFDVRKGSIFGIAGVDGNGQVELAEALAGIRDAHQGTIAGPSKVGYIPQDRQSDGLAMGMTISENLYLGAIERPEFRCGLFLNRPAINTWAQSLVEEFKIKVGSIQDPITSLSGGNQQKIVVSRTLSANPELIVAVSPTRGLDFAAARFVHESLLIAAQNGAIVILITSDLDELSLTNEHRFLSRGLWSDSMVGASA
jgi:simple sugar transport system ATP-binding protein